MGLPNQPPLKVVFDTMAALAEAAPPPLQPAVVGPALGPELPDDLEGLVVEDVTAFDDDDDELFDMASLRRLLDDPKRTNAVLRKYRVPAPLDPCASRLSAATFHYLCAQRCSATEGERSLVLYERALRDARAAAARAPPGASGAHNLLGAVCDRLGLGGEALEAYKRAAKEDPKDCHAHFNVGAAHQKRGELVLAEHAYIRATRAWNKYALAYYNLANVLQKKGEGLRAVEAYKDCVAADPTFEKAHAALAFFHEKNGDKVRAHRHKVAAQTKGEAARRAQQPVATGAGKHCADYSRFDKVVDSSDDEFERKVGYEPPTRINWPTEPKYLPGQEPEEVKDKRLPWCKNDPGNKDGRRYSKRGF